jgi:hypothetical protein
VIRPEFRLPSQPDLRRIEHLLPALGKEGMEALTVIDRIRLLANASASFGRSLTSIS